MALPLLALALPLAAMLAVTDAPRPAGPETAFAIAGPMLDLPRQRPVLADRQALPRVKAPGYDGPWMFDGPVLSAQRGARGAQFELGALGGGHDWAPSLAHVAVDWQF